ncbi:MAG: hypothetical protein ACM3VT_10790 [Solirubrobacterales bacterium]
MKASVMSRETDRVRSSAQAYADDLRQNSSLGAYTYFMELGMVAEQVDTLGSIQLDQWLRPFVRQMVEHLPTDDLGGLDSFARSIEANKWFDYGRMFFEECREKGLIGEADAASMLAKIEAWHVATTMQRVALSESSGSVALYMANLDGAPLGGDLDMNDLHTILDKGLLTAYPDGDPDSRRKTVENVLRLIHLIAGGGPFHGDEAQLVESVQRFCQLYRVMGKADIPIDTVLATFLALSFYDTSTAEDHAGLLSQFHACGMEVKAQLSRMLSDRALESLVAPDDIDRVVALHEERFHSYVTDPLWPMFKFPFTDNEKSRLMATMTQSLMQLGAVLDPVSTKVKYGGTTPELKKNAIYEISSAVQQLLPAAAFLRRPPYPGITCQYRGAYGFAAWIDGSFYDEGDRAKEKFKAMKYFHLGHRLEDVVERERQFYVPPVREDGSQKK